MAGLSTQASIAWANARLYEQLNQQLHERRVAEQRLEEAIVEAQAANESKSKFLANMSHEIRTPMTAILGYADVLLTYLEDPDNRECVETISRNGNYLLELINDILDLSKIEAGRLDINPQPVTPVQIMAGVISLMNVRARKKSLDLEIDFASRIPETITSDPIRLRQVLVNLVGNAIKFTREGRITIGVQLIEEPEPRLKFSVADTGIGMTETEQEALFEPFRQGRSPVGVESTGTGLGLTICQRLVDMLGGEISVDSEPNVGTTVHFTIDVGELDDVDFIEPGDVIARPRQPISVATVRLDCKVLVVDDRREIRVLAAHYLEEAGATVETASDGKQAVTAVERAARDGVGVDAVIMDMQMPRMDGYQATKKLRRLGYEMPIIALTAAAMNSDRIRCLDAGCNDYVAKPVRADELSALVAEHTGAGGSTKDVGLADDGQATSQFSPPEDPQFRHVLLVEDNHDVRKSLVQLLELSGHFEVTAAANGREATETARGAEFDLVLLDLQLGDTSGYEVLEKLQKIDEMSDATFVALTGWSTPERRERSMKAGFDHHIVKPLSPETLHRL